MNPLSPWNYSDISYIFRDPESTSFVTRKITTSTDNTVTVIGHKYLKVFKWRRINLT